MFYAICFGGGTKGAQMRGFARLIARSLDCERNCACVYGGGGDSWGEGVTESDRILVTW